MDINNIDNRNDYSHGMTEDEKAIILRRVTQIAQCDVCPACHNENIINNISFDDDNILFGKILYQHAMLCNECKLSFVYSGHISKIELDTIRVTSKDSGEFSYKVLLKALEKSREAIYKALEGNKFGDGSKVNDVTLKKVGH